MKRPASAALSSSDRTERQTRCSSAELPPTALRSFFSSAASRNFGSAVLPPLVTALLLQAAPVMPNVWRMLLLDPVVLHCLLLYPS